PLPLTRDSLRLLAAVLLLDRAPHRHHGVPRAWHRALDEHEVVLWHQLGDLEVQRRHRLVPVVAGHLQAGQRTTGRHVRADRPAVPPVLVRAMGLDRASHAPPPDDAAEPATARLALGVDELADLEDLVHGELLTDLELGDMLGRGAELADGLLRGLVYLLV